MLRIEDIFVGDLIHVVLNDNHFLVIHKNDKKEHLGCRLVKSDTTVDIDYDRSEILSMEIRTQYSLKG